MSGHSKWSTIKRAKGAADAKRGNMFTKLGNAITLAAKLGNSGDINANPRLRMAVEAGRAVNMPKENIQRAIDRGLGKLPGQVIEEVLYEGFGPPAGGGKVAFIVEGLTDNRMRTTAEIKNQFDRAGGALGAQGSVTYMFDKKGEIRVKGKGGSLDDEMLELMDTGAEDIEDYEDEGVQKYLVYTQPADLFLVSTNITQLGFEVEENAIVYRPNMTVEIKDKETADKVLSFIERIEEHDDVQKVYANFDISDQILFEIQRS